MHSYHTDDLSPFRLNRVHGPRESSDRSPNKKESSCRAFSWSMTTRWFASPSRFVCQRQGFEVTVADGGEAGMRALESSDFDVMLIDVFMPHMRGFESIRMFHERKPDIPIIAMSGYAFANTERAPDFLRMTIELGATCCLRKPFTPNALLATRQ